MGEWRAGIPGVVPIAVGANGTGGVDRAFRRRVCLSHPSGELLRSLHRLEAPATKLIGAFVDPPPNLDRNEVCQWLAVALDQDPLTGGRRVEDLAEPLPKVGGRDNPHG